ncbi:hypothetical protein ACJIZ3_005498 [Penstemon smallii]|uniref:Proteasome subunit beta n=1 Tax=Penstemon smallii TaxID=265156 RepID=A0ABD3S525_9LAMI
MSEGGFSFDLRKRNDMLASKGLKPPSLLKTGTTVVGLIFQDGVILGADGEGPNIVADKKCEKIHYMAPNIYCCGDKDTEAVTDMVSSQLELHRYDIGRESRVVTALTLLKSHLLSSYQGRHDVSDAALVLGGVDVTGPHLHTVYLDGSTDSTLPFATMGSGSLAAMAIFESKYRQGLTRDEGVKLVAGIFNLLGSRSNVDICVITKGKQEYLRNYLLPNPPTYDVSENFSKEAPKAAKSTNLYSLGHRMILENAIDDI